MAKKALLVGLAIIAVVGIAWVGLAIGTRNLGFAALFSGLDENVLYKSINAQLARATATDLNGSIEVTERVQKQDSDFAEIFTDQNNLKGGIEADFNSELPGSASLGKASVTISYGLSTQKALAGAVGGPTEAEGQMGTAILAIAIVAGIIVVAMVVYFMVLLPKG